MLYVLQDKPVTTKHDKLGDISFKVEVPQAQSLAEATTMCGGEQALLDFVNSGIATNAKNAARAYARNYTVAEGVDPATYPQLVTTVQTTGQAQAKDYNPASDTERGPSKTKKAAGFDAISALIESGQELTKEALLKILAGAK